MTTTPSIPGLYLDAAGSPWQVRDIGAGDLVMSAVGGVEFGTPARVAHDGPYTPLVPLSEASLDLIVRALADELAQPWQWTDVERERATDLAVMLATVRDAA